MARPGVPSRREDFAMKALYCLGYTLTATLLRAFFQFRVYGRENLPRGKAIVAVNHQSYVDPPVAGAAIQQEVWYLAREDVFRFAPFRWLCARVNAIMIRKSRAHRSALKAVLKQLDRGRKVVVFPEGTRSYDGRLQTPERGISLLAHKSRAPVIPAYISGTHRVLPRGGLRIRLHPISVSFGPPLRFDPASAGLKAGVRSAYQAFSQRVMEGIAALKANLEAKRAG